MGDALNPFLRSLPLILLFTSILAAEIRLLKWSVTAYAVQGLVLAGVLAGAGWMSENEALFSWATTVLISKGIILPWLLSRYAGRTAGAEEPGPAFGPGMFLASLIAVGGFAAGERFVPWALAEVPGAAIGIPAGAGAAVGIMAVALWTLLTHRDTLKVVIGICLLENGVHLLLASVASSIPETAGIGIVTDVVLSIWLLLLVGRQAESAAGTRTDSVLDQLRG
ncbi:MAG TPA: hypothetical protein VGK74_03430 [Symbiobacteriaceae bacterium]